ncbi:MAG TPA: hypothetical protein IAB04_04460 [Candidatus Avimonoglobus intestinipullorum]|uniref:SbsA Ig-like domain-containing protein n=1 Tax=Candidatus Avimonoglobus intestinipullorum TaxID=2840699 RepID=A0A9D1S6R2_9FIRM|nr:hypothetical protein [Candidatus Avimonoglobus intestinipullorum]
MKKRILSGLISLAMAAALIPAAAAETTTFEYTFDFNDTSVLPAAGTDFAWANGGREVPAGSVAGPSGEAGDYAFGYVPSEFANGTAGEESLHLYANGVEFLNESLVGENRIADVSFVMSVDFMYRNAEDMIAYILSPRMASKERRHTYPLAIKLQQGGELVCVTEERAYDKSTGINTITVLSSTDIGTVAPYEWHNVAVKYTHSSTDGLYADVYLNGELKAEGLHCDYTNKIKSFASLASPLTNTALFQNRIYPAGRNEQIYLDNLYIGTDLTKVDYDFGINAVENKRMDRLTVHFNQDIEAASAGDFIVSNSDGFPGAIVTEATMIDARTVELQLDAELEEYAEYAVMFMTDQAGDVSYSFTPQLAYFYDFNGSDTTYTPFSLNSKHNVRRPSGAGAYNTDSTDLDFTFVTHPGTNPGGSAMDHNKNGYNIYLTPDLETVTITSGTIQVDFDFKYDNETMFGWLVAPRQGKNPPNFVGFENNRLYCGGTYADGVVLAPNTWYNIAATYNFYDGGILTDVYLDGELVINDVFNGYTGGINAISTLIDAHTPPEYAGMRADDVSTRNEYFHMDNVYIGIDTDYRNSAFEIGFDGDDAVINAGIFNKAGTAVVALYDGQTLKEAKLYDFDLEQLDVETVSAAFDSYEEGNTIKLIALDGMQNLTPLIEAAVK